MRHCSTHRILITTLVALAATCAAAPNYIPPWQGPTVEQYTSNWLQRINRLVLDLADTTGNDGFDSYVGDINTLLKDSSIAMAKLDNSSFDFVYTTRVIVAGDGLTGGGHLADDVTLNVRVGRGLSISSDYVVVDSAIVSSGLSGAACSNTFLLNSGGTLTGNLAVQGDELDLSNADKAMLATKVIKVDASEDSDHDTTLVLETIGCPGDANAIIKLYPHGAEIANYIDASSVQIKNVGVPLVATDAATLGTVSDATNGCVQKSGVIMFGNILFSEATARIGGTSGTTPTDKHGTDVELAGGDGGYNGHAGDVSIHAGVKPHAVGGMPWTTGTVTLINLPTPTLPDQAAPKSYPDNISNVLVIAMISAASQASNTFVPKMAYGGSGAALTVTNLVEAYSVGTGGGKVGVVKLLPHAVGGVGYVDVSDTQVKYLADPTAPTDAATWGCVIARVSGMTAISTNVIASYMQVTGSGFILSNRLEITGWANGVCTSTIPSFSDVKVGEYAVP